MYDTWVNRWMDGLMDVYACGGRIIGAAAAALPMQRLRVIYLVGGRTHLLVASSNLTKGLIECKQASYAPLLSGTIGTSGGLIGIPEYSSYFLTGDEGLFMNAINRSPGEQVWHVSSVVSCVEQNMFVA